jgi:hypothetical protein
MAAALMDRIILDPADYARRFCIEVDEASGQWTGRGEPQRLRSGKVRAKRRIFLRMYQYRGESFVFRAYERILNRPPDASEFDAAKEAFFREPVSPTSFMLGLRFGEEGRLMRSCNLVGLSAIFFECQACAGSFSTPRPNRAGKGRLTTRIAPNPGPPRC